MWKLDSSLFSTWRSNSYITSFCDISFVCRLYYFYSAILVALQALTVYLFNNFILLLLLQLILMKN